MLTELKVKDGVYTNMREVYRRGDNEVTYAARFTLKDGYSEQRVVVVKNNKKVIAWQS